VRIVLTGINGYIGFHLARRLLKRGFSVIGIDLNDSHIKWFNDQDKFSFLKYDITNSSIHYGNIEDTDVLIHCAALVHRRSQGLSRSNYFNVNALGTINMLSALNQKKLKQIIFLSTVSVYGEGGRSLTVNEDTPVSPVDFYGQSKVEAENYIMKYSQEKGINFTIFRLAPVYGKDFLLNLKKRVCLGNERFFFRIASGNQKMSLCSVNNVVDTVTSSMGNEACFNEIFILRDRNNYQANEVIDAVKKILRRTKKKTYSIPLFLPEIVLRCVSLASPNMGKSLRYQFGKIAADCVYPGDKLHSKGSGMRWNLMNTLLD
jgi:nucleoside-diphosphate-sugar epimerase